MRENPSKARPKKKDKQSSVADVGHGDGCYATLSRGTIGGGVVTTNTASHFTHPFLLVHYCNPLHWGSSSQSTSSAGPTSLQTEVDGGWLHHAHLVKTNSFNKWDYKIWTTQHTCQDSHDIHDLGRLWLWTKARRRSLNPNGDWRIPSYFFVACNKSFLMIRLFFYPLMGKHLTRVGQPELHCRSPKQLQHLIFSWSPTMKLRTDYMLLN